jgi:hypothetical protein
MLHGYEYVYRYQPDTDTGICHFLLKTDVDTFFKTINIALIMAETINKVVIVSFCTKYAILLEHNIESRGYKRG